MGVEELKSREARAEPWAGVGGGGGGSCGGGRIDGLDGDEEVFGVVVFAEDAGGGVEDQIGAGVAMGEVGGGVRGDGSGGELGVAGLDGSGAGDGAALAEPGF